MQSSIHEVVLYLSSVPLRSFLGGANRVQCAGTSLRGEQRGWVFEAGALDDPGDAAVAPNEPVRLQAAARLLTFLA